MEKNMRQPSEINKRSPTLYICGSIAIATACIVLTNVFGSQDYPTEAVSSQSDLAWWQTAIIYQIYPRSFQDSDGDGVGDLQGIRSRLDYLKYINVGAIWINTFYKSPMRDFGYDVVDHTEVDPLFGTMADFDELVKECHEKDIKVIVDLVPNHTSNESEWFNKSRHAGNTDSIYRDFYVWNPGKLVDGQRHPPTNWPSKFGGPAWDFDPVRGEYYYHNYLSSQPDLNYRHRPVINEMANVLRFWLEKGVDGIRIDAVTYLFEVEDLSLNYEPGDTKLNRYQKDQPEIFSVVKHFRQIVDEFERKDGKPRLWLAEAVSIDWDTRMKYYKAGAVPFYFKLVGAKQICNATAQCYLTLIKEGVNVDKEQWPTFVVGNHDHTRVSDEIGSDYVDVLNMMLLTLPGTATTYYGEELGMRGGNYTGLPPKDNKAIASGDITRSRDPVRNPMQWDDSLNAGFTSSPDPWLPVASNTNHTHVNVKVEMVDPHSHLSLYKRLAHLRQIPAFRTTVIGFPDEAQDILMYTRGINPNIYAVLLNFGLQESSANFQSLFTNYTIGIVEISSCGRDGEKVTLSDITLQKGEGMVLKLGS